MQHGDDDGEKEKGTDAGRVAIAHGSATAYFAEIERSVGATCERYASVSKAVEALRRSGPPERWLSLSLYDRANREALVFLRVFSELVRLETENEEAMRGMTLGERDDYAKLMLLGGETASGMSCTDALLDLYDDAL